MNRIILCGLLACAVAAGGCGGPSCSDKGHCSADTTKLSDEIPACQKIFDGSCGSAFKDYISCLESNEVCGADGNGFVDQGRCDTQSTAFENCCKATPSACP